MFFDHVVVRLYFSAQGAIHCPEDQPCTIVCLQTHCLNSHINCPAQNHCNITCNHRSCHQTTINATESSSFDLYLHPKLHSNLTAYLPPSSRHPRTHIHQTPLTFDTNSVTKDSAHPSDDTLFTIYSINGFNDLIPTIPHLPHGTMHCKPQYTSFCAFSTASVSCIDDHHPCDKTLPIAKQSHRRRLLQSVRSIDPHLNGGVYSDNTNVALAPDPYGWSIGGNQAGRITVSSPYNVIGPFSGTGNTVVDSIVNITQQFWCNVPADVSVSYRLFWCGDTESDDYAKLYLNDVEQTDATVWGMPDTEFTDYVSTQRDDSLIANSNNIFALCARVGVGALNAIFLNIFASIKSKSLFDLKIKTSSFSQVDRSITKQ